MQSAAAQLGQRRADSGRQAALARKMWQLLRARLRGDVSSKCGCQAGSLLGGCGLCASLHDTERLLLSHTPSRVFPPHAPAAGAAGTPMAH